MVSDQIIVLRGRWCVMCEMEAATTSILQHRVSTGLQLGAYATCFRVDIVLSLGPGPPPPPKALADCKWDQENLDQQHLCQQPHLSLLTLVGFFWGPRHQYKGPLLGADGEKRKGEK